MIYSTSDLVDGCIVTYRNGQRRKVKGKNFIGVNTGKPCLRNYIKKYSFSLTHETKSALDIVKVEFPDKKPDWEYITKDTEITRGLLKKYPILEKVYIQGLEDGEKQGYKEGIKSATCDIRNSLKHIERHSGL